MACPMHWQAENFISAENGYQAACDFPVYIGLYCSNTRREDDYGTYSEKEIDEDSQLFEATYAVSCEEARQLLNGVSQMCSLCGEVHSQWVVRPCGYIYPRRD